MRKFFSAPLFCMLLSTTLLAQDSQQPAPIERPAQQPSDTSQPEHQPTATFTAITRAVVLDIVVTGHDGHPIKGLKASNFALTEDGVPQTLDSFEEHNAMSPADVARLAPPALPPNTFTNRTTIPNTNASTVILLDALDTPISAQMYLRGQVIDYIKTMPAGASIAIFQLNTSLRLIQGFTSDPNLLLDAVTSSKRDMPQSSLLLGNHSYPAVQNRQDILVSSMQTLGRYLAGFPGRKNLIWFTGIVPRAVYGEGIGAPFSDDLNFIDNFANTTDVLTLSRVAVYPIDSRGLQTDPAFSAEHRGIPPVNTGFGTRQFYQHADLDDVADATGGKAFYNTNGLKQAIAEVIDSGSNYYTVSYTPTNRNWNNTTRQIRLQVDIPGAALQYRHSYYAYNRNNAEKTHLAKVQRHGAYKPAATPAPAGKAGTPEQNLDASMALGAIPATQLVFDASLAPSNSVQKLDRDKPLPPDNYLAPDFQKKPFRDYNILFGLDAHQLQLLKGADGLRHGELELVAVLYTDQGEMVNSAISTVTMNLKDATYASILQSGFRLHQNIAVPTKGNYFLRLGALDAVGNKVGAMEIPVDEIKLGVAGLGQTLAP